MTPETTALGRLYQVRDDRAGDAATQLPLMSVSQYHGVVPRLGLMGDAGRADDLSNYKVCSPGDLVLNRMSAYKGALGVAREAGLVSPDYLVLTPNGQVDADFLSRWLKTPLGISEMTQRLRGIGGADSAQVRTPRINHKDLRGIELVLPTVAEQRAIADYLDRETAQIDALIGKQERLIELLQERRVATLEQALLDLTWSTPLRVIAELIQTGPFGSQLKSDEYVEGGVSVINPSHMIGNRVVPDPKIAVSSEKADELSRHRLRAGDLVVARRGELGRCAVVTSDTAGALCGTGSALVRPRSLVVDSRFLALVYSSRAIRESLALASVGSTMDNLNASIVAGLRVPLPTLVEQRDLVSKIDEQTSKVDALIAKAERFIALSKERRAALITAAVTGQIDVREAV